VQIRTALGPVPDPPKRPRDTKRDTKKKPADAKSAGLLVGHPGLEPGANGLRTQRLAGHKALFVSDSGTPAPAIAVNKGDHATYSGQRERLDRAGLLRAIAHAREAKIIAEDHARTLAALVELVGGALGTRPLAGQDGPISFNYALDEFNNHLGEQFRFLLMGVMSGVFKYYDFFFFVLCSKGIIDIRRQFYGNAAIMPSPEDK